MSGDREIMLSVLRVTGDAVDLSGNSWSRKSDVMSCFAPRKNLPYPGTRSIDAYCRSNTCIGPRDLAKEKAAARENRRRVNDFTAAASSLFFVQRPAVDITRKLGGSEDQVEAVMTAIEQLGGAASSHSELAADLRKATPPPRSPLPTGLVK